MDTATLILMLTKLSRSGSGKPPVEADAEHQKVLKTLAAIFKGGDVVRR